MSDDGLSWLRAAAHQRQRAEVLHYIAEWGCYWRSPRQGPAEALAELVAEGVVIEYPDRPASAGMVAYGLSTTTPPPASPWNDEDEELGE